MNSRPRIYLVSLGCPKNLVDSEGMTTLLENAGCTTVGSPEQADLLIVNTCGFIRSAREESRAVLQELALAKRPGQRLIAAGCYAQRSPHGLADAVPGIDGLIGTRRWTDIVTLVERLDERPEKGHAAFPCIQLPESHPPGQAPLELPRVAVQGTSAYLKLADGCRRSCAFCAIPLIKGTAVSRRTEDILADAALLAERGVQEIILIAQDTTGYGHDLGLPNGLPNLLRQLVRAVPQVPWIRLMYAFPGPAVDRLIEAMARHPQILPYLDIPLQHAHPDVLRRMHRPSDVEKVRQTVERMRAMIPDIAVRTTFLVGFPGETEAEFQVLIDFVAEMAFDRVGVFAYSHEEDTPAARMADDVPQAVKEARCERLMAIQQPISLAKNQALVGQALDVLLEGQGDGLSVGRSYRDAPEIDGLVLVQAELPVGEIVPVRVTAALEYDLVATPL
jgi:ribosomal protein S12 methylthiotransferase